MPRLRSRSLPSFLGFALLAVGLFVEPLLLASDVSAKPAKAESQSKAQPKKTQKTQSKAKPSSKASSTKAAGSKAAGSKASKTKPKKGQAKPRTGKKARTVESSDWASAPAAKYAALDKQDCYDELKSRAVKFVTEEPSRGIVAPVRIGGAINGVIYRTELSTAERAKTPYEVMDCRLALALFDFSEILKKHSIDEAHIFSAWRPPQKDWPADKAATRHPGGLAIDVRRLLKKPANAGDPVKDLVVERDWSPARDVPPCTPDARKELSGNAKDLRDVFCDANDARVFTSMLSPNYNAAHENHFHLEVTPGVRWRLVL